MRTISVLFTNNTLALRAGSEMYVRDVALALLRRGHRPTAFSLVLGETADELRRATVPVVDDLARLGSPPDVIHGHHHLETLIAALTFPETPIVHFCHGWVPWEEMPLRHPSIARYIAVDEVCLDRLVREEGVAPDAVEVLHNFVDLDRFKPRGPLPPSPRRALVFSNQATADGYTRMIRAACAAAGIALDIVGAANGNSADTPETLLRDYDLVFAKGRSALEALTVGCAVILADAAGCGPLVTPANFDRLRSRNFGIRELQNPHDPAWYTREIAGYSADAAACVSARARAVAGLEPAVDRLLDIYAAAIAGQHQTAGASQAAARHLTRIAGPLKSAHDLSIAVRNLTRDLELARRERDAETIAVRNSAREVDLTRRERHTESLALADAVARAAENERLRAQLAASEERAKLLDAELAAYRSLPTLRLRDALLRLPVLGRLLQIGARRCADALDRLSPTAR
jgi:hypothetical protein